MAAGEAAGGGAAVTLLDGEQRPGKKLLLTGKGRCNLSNTLPLEGFLEGFGANGVFLRNACTASSPGSCGSSSPGSASRPPSSAAAGSTRSAGAAAVLEALLAWVGKRGVRVLTGQRVARLTREPDGGFLVSGAGFAEGADRVVLAVGGASYPQTGSRGDGYRIAAALGHRIVTPARPWSRWSAANRFSSVSRVSAAQRQAHCPPAGGTRIASFGEVHATPFGISGPAVFPVSGVSARSRGRPRAPAIDLKPALDATSSSPPGARIQLPREPDLAALLATLLPRQLVPVFLEVAGLPARSPPRRPARRHGGPSCASCGPSRRPRSGRCPSRRGWPPPAASTCGRCTR